MVPKAMRERLHLLGGGEVEITERDGVVEVVPAAASVRVEHRPGGPVAIPDENLPALTDAEVLAALDASRR